MNDAFERDRNTGKFSEMLEENQEKLKSFLSLRIQGLTKKNRQSFKV
jgi:hypothetical protein